MGFLVVFSIFCKISALQNGLNDNYPAVSSLQKAKKVPGGISWRATPGGVIR